MLRERGKIKQPGEDTGNLYQRRKLIKGGVGLITGKENDVSNPPLVTIYLLGRKGGGRSRVSPTGKGRGVDLQGGGGRS